MNRKNIIIKSFFVFHFILWFLLFLLDFALKNSTTECLIPKSCAMSISSPIFKRILVYLTIHFVLSWHFLSWRQNCFIILYLSRLIFGCAEYRIWKWFIQVFWICSIFMIDQWIDMCGRFVERRSLLMDLAIAFMTVSWRTISFHLPSLYFFD